MYKSLRKSSVIKKCHDFQFSQVRRVKLMAFSCQNNFINLLYWVSLIIWSGQEYTFYSVSQSLAKPPKVIYIISWHPRILSTKQSHNVSPLESYWANTNYTLIQQFSAYEANWSGGGGGLDLSEIKTSNPPPPPKKEEKCLPILLECYLFFADLNKMIDSFIKYDYVYLCEKKWGGGGLRGD